MSWREKCQRELLAELSSRQINPSVLDGYDPQGFYGEMPQSAASRAVRERPSGLSISIVRTIRCARENARTLRPLISTEMWTIA